MSQYTALITGASSGIGSEYARIHASKGDNLVLVGRNEVQLTEMKSELERTYKVKVTTIVQDLSEPGAAKLVYDEVKHNGIEIEYLINNAGLGGRGIFYERSMEEDRVMMETNMNALTELTRLFLPEFVRRNHGRILNMSSTAALMPGPMHAVYFATKAYVSYLSFALVKELEHTNVTVTAVLPGPVNTRFAERADMTNSVLFQHSASPEKVARIGYEAMIKGKRQVYAGVPLWMRLSFIFMPFTPMKTILNLTYKMQLDK
ncbi:MAG: SDR family oxidoreductase [Clostridiales bacterium]|nr:SDR family oxidoreductase [Clostridiales bacterium]